MAQNGYETNKRGTNVKQPTTGATLRWELKRGLFIQNYIVLNVEIVFREVRIASATLIANASWHST